MSSAMFLRLCFDSLERVLPTGVQPPGEGPAHWRGGQRSAHGSAKPGGGAGGPPAPGGGSGKPGGAGGVAQPQTLCGACLPGRNPQ